MSVLRNNDYCNMPFTTEFCQDDFYTYTSVADLVSKCEFDKEKIIKIRTTGILESSGGRFFIKDVDSVDKSVAPQILVSMYVKSALQSPVIPYTVQIFGTMQWNNRPVIFAKIVQVLNTATALRLINAMKSICSRHLANYERFNE